MSRPDTTLGLTLGPVLYLWQPDAWRDFYYRIADESDFDTVVVGEVVCSKRQHFHEHLLADVTGRLQRAGKTVRAAALGLVTLERERHATHQLAAEALELEAGDLTAHAAMEGRPHAIGPLVNVYNAATARVLASRGAHSICLPPELPMDSIRSIVAGTPNVGFEVFAFGRVPLAISARCAHARVKGRTKDNCQFVCGEDPDGLEVDTLDGQHFLALNGVQTMSSTAHCLVGDIPRLIEAGIDSLRLSPQVCDMVGVAAVYRQAAEGGLEADAALEQIARLYPSVTFSNGFLHGVPGHLMVTTQGT